MPFCQITLKGKRPLAKAYPKILKTLGDHLRKKRLDLKLLQKDVARIIGVTESTIWNWEHGTDPEKRYMKRINGFLSDYKAATKLNLRPTD